jgi:hypothetical protein
LNGSDTYYTDGDVAVGKTVPDEKLDVDGNINSSGVYMIDGTTALQLKGESTFLGESGSTVHWGDYNTFVGYYAGDATSTANNNTFVGSSAGRLNSTGHSNTFVGTEAGINTTTGYDNTFVGKHAGYFNKTGSNNTFIGEGSGYENETVSANTFIGASAGSNHNTGDHNTFVGNASGYHHHSGGNNTFLGCFSGQSHGTGEDNTFVGYLAGFSSNTGSHNTFVGQSAGYGCEGDNNTIVGDNAGFTNISGNGNVFLGYNAGYSETDSDKLYIDNSNTSTPLIWGDFANDKVAINSKLGVGTNPGTYTLELSGCTGGNCAGKPDGTTWTNTSDIRLKDIHGNYEWGLTELAHITPVRFSYKKANELGLPSRQELVGLVAQEVEDVIPEAVSEDDRGYLRLNADPVLWAMLNAIKELKTEVETLKERVKELEAQR